MDGLAIGSVTSPAEVDINGFFPVIRVLHHCDFRQQFSDPPWPMQGFMLVFGQWIRSHKRFFATENASFRAGSTPKPADSASHNIQHRNLWDGWLSPSPWLPPKHRSACRYSGVPDAADDIAWVNDYAAEVLKIFGKEFGEAADRFKDGQVLLDRFSAAIATVLKNGRGHFRAVDEAHNELCVVSALLANTKLKFIRLEYEPPLPGCAKTIDFRATADSGQIAYVDVETIKPGDTDRWEQFERARAEGWFPENVVVGLSRHWLGGEIWHAWFAARARMYSLEMEQKIEEAGLAADNGIRVLALCGDGFRWHQDQLEDFVAFYFRGVYHGDDSFALVERKCTRPCC